jgi:hypothetical protein
MLLVIGNMLFDKKAQPAWEKISAEELYGLD